MLRTCAKLAAAVCRRRPAFVRSARYRDRRLAQHRVAAGVGRGVGDRVDASAARAAALVSEQELAVVGAEGRALDVTGLVAVTETVVGLVARDRDEPDGWAGIAGIPGHGRHRHEDELVVRG